MTYATAAELAEFVGSQYLALTDKDGDDEPDPEVETAALAYADALIDATVAGRYTTPLPSSPVLAASALAIAHARLYAGRPMPEYVASGREVELAFLHRVAAGKANLPGATAGTEADVAAKPASRAVALKGDADRTFTAETLKGYTE